MPESKPNLFQPWEFPPEAEPKFVNAHVINWNGRELYLAFGLGRPHKLLAGDEKHIKAVSQVILTKEHLQELVLNLQKQLVDWGKQGGPAGESGPGPQKPNPRI